MATMHTMATGLLESRPMVGPILYIGRAICLPNGEHKQNGYRAYRGYQVFRNQ
jgi:hypothetical protein